MIEYRTSIIRIYPTEEQRKGIDINIDNNRKIYNWAINYKSILYNLGGAVTDSNKMYKELVKLMENEFNYMRNEYADSQAYQCTLKAADKAFISFCKGLTQYPKIKKKWKVQSYTTKNSNINKPKSSIRVSNNKLKLPKYGYIKVKGAEGLEEKKLTRATIIRKGNKYYANVVYKQDVEYEETVFDQSMNIIGIDVGIKHMFTLSDSSIIDMPNFEKKYANKLKMLHKKLSRQSSGSHNHKKTVNELYRISNKISNQRHDFIHKTTNSIAKKYDVVVIEDYYPSEWIKPNKRSVNKKLMANCLSIAKDQLKYKCARENTILIIADKSFPSTKICNNCGYLNANVSSLDIREWSCSNCGHHHDRDVNAAMNLRDYPINYPNGYAS